MNLIRNKKIFITGGMGFIGSNIVKKLIEKEASVKIYDNFSSGSLENLCGLNISPKLTNLKIVKADILDKKKLTAEMKGSDLVIHHAAQLEITKAITDPYFDLSSNTIGTINVLEAMLKNKIDKLVNASSACVYGQKEKKDIPTKESYSTNPNWAYGASKLAAEKYCSIYKDLHKLKIISCRYSIVYGQNEWFGRVMTIYLKNALLNKPLTIFDKGFQTRDFIHVNDVANFNIDSIGYLLKSSGKEFHHIFNVSTGKETKIIQLAKEIKKLFGKKVAIVFDKVTQGEKSVLIDRVRLPNELVNMVLDNSLAKKIIGWSPQVALNLGLNLQIEWVRNNISRWKKMSY